jgi:ubiquinone/menaquinone biosynthesis C-methylase UbiE/catechol 2,3-dioxygenase-like lactoylglutathione lyase family enzyme
MQHKSADAPATAGLVLHGARWYDLFGGVISFGRDKAIREQLIELAEPSPGENVLDVGCGTGSLAIAIKSRVGAGEVHGIDASPEMIQVAREKAARGGLDIDFRVALIEAIPFPDASFDLVISSLMLHHLPDDLKSKGFLEIRRVLRRSGRFLAVDFAAHSHSPLGHLLSIFGYSRGENMVEKLTPILENAGLGDVGDIPTRHRNFAFIRARGGMSAPRPNDVHTLATSQVATRLPAQDLERARIFYEEKLGLQPIEERPGGLRYQLSNGWFALFESAGAPSGEHTQMGFDVEDLEATVAELRRRGVVFEEYDVPGLKTVNGIAMVDGNCPSHGGRGEKSAWFRDSEGNLLGLGQAIR